MRHRLKSCGQYLFPVCLCLAAAKLEVERENHLRALNLQDNNFMECIFLIYNIDAIDKAK